MQLTLLKCMQRWKGVRHVVLCRDVLIRRVDCRSLELGWSGCGRDSEFLDPAFERDRSADDPLGDATHSADVLTPPQRVCNRVGSLIVAYLAP